MSAVITRFNADKPAAELEAYIALNRFKPHSQRIGVQVYRDSEGKLELHVAADWARLFRREKIGKKAKLKSVNGWNIT